MKTICLLLVSVGFCSCSTFFESTQSSYRPSPVYKAEKNEKGETVYRSKTLYQNDSLYVKPTLLTEGTTVQATSQNFSDSTATVPQGVVSNSLVGQVDLAAYDRQTHLGVHVGSFLDGDWLLPRIGVSMFKSDDEYFFGFDGSARIYVTSISVRPFLGLGLHVGDTKKCQTHYNNQFGLYEESCEKKFLYAGYYEVGLEYKKISLFMRSYKIDKAGIEVPTDQFFGLGLVFGVN